MDTTVAVSEKKAVFFLQKSCPWSPPKRTFCVFGSFLHLKSTDFSLSQLLYRGHFFSGASQKANQNLRQQGDLIFQIRLFRALLKSLSSGQAISLQDYASPRLRTAQFNSHLHLSLYIFSSVVTRTLLDIPGSYYICLLTRGTQFGLIRRCNIDYKLHLFGLN